MNKYIIVALAFLSVGVIVTGRRIRKNGYYWRPYDGTMPSDAITAGYSRGKPVYIGQAPINGKIIPGQMQEDDLNLYFEWDEEAWSTNSGIKVLCTLKADKFTWISTSNSDLLKMNKKQLVIGGYQRGLGTYIGRVQPDGETVVGKVICGDSSCYALYAVKDGKPVEYHSYEVLAYIPDSNDRNVPFTSGVPIGYNTYCVHSQFCENSSTVFVGL